MPKEFAFNAGKTGQIFDLKESSYINSVPPKERPALIKAATSFVVAGAAGSAPYQTVYESKSGTLVEAHPLSFKNSDFNDILKKARELANSKLPIKVIQIPPILEKGDPLRKTLLPDVKGNHNPDFNIDGKWIDAKQPTGEKVGKNTIQRNISRANEQASGIVLYIDDNAITENQLFEDIYKKMHHSDYDGFELYLKYGNEWSMFDKAQFIEEYKKRKKPQ